MIIGRYLGHIVSMSKEESEIQGRKNAHVLADTMLSSANAITVGGNHIALQTKRFSFYFMVLMNRSPFMPLKSF